MGRGRSWYQILQVDPRAEPEIIEAAYRRLAKKYHPDVTTSRDAGERMKEINAAYAVLRDPVQRAVYDRELLERAASAQRRSLSNRPTRRLPKRMRLLLLTAFWPVFGTGRRLQSVPGATAVSASAPLASIVSSRPAARTAS